MTLRDHDRWNEISRDINDAERARAIRRRGWAIVGCFFGGVLSLILGAGYVVVHFVVKYW